MNPSRGRDAFALPIYEAIFLINTYGQSLWKALFSPHDARYCVQYEAHYLLGDYNMNTLKQVVIAMLLVGVMALVGPRLAELYDKKVEADKRREAAQKQIVSEVIPLASRAKTMSSDIKIHGRVLVWDVEHDRPFWSTSWSPSELKAGSHITVFMIVDSHYKQVGTYSPSGLPANRVDTDIAVAYWPEKIPAGCFTVIGSNPPDYISRNAMSSQRDGDTTTPIARWIKHLPVSEP
jgi:hypothetical protein